MMSVLEILCHQSFHLTLPAFSFNTNVFSNVCVISCSKTSCFVCWWLPARFTFSCLSSLMVSGWKLCRLSQTPNPHPFLSLGAILFSLNASKRNAFPPEGEEWDTTRHHPHLCFCSPFAFSPFIVLQQSFLWCLFSPVLDLQKHLRQSVFSCDKNICIQVVDAGVCWTCCHYQWELLKASWG